MSQWITDRLPTEADADVYGEVWDCYGELAFWTDIEEHQPWQPTNCPGKYVHLIAAAPDMLEALKVCAAHIGNMPHPDFVNGGPIDIVYAQALQAIAKAEGRQADREEPTP